VRAVTGSLRTASLIASLPLSGEVRLLTAGALDGPDSVFSPATFGSGSPTSRSPARCGAVPTGRPGRC